MRSFSQYAVKIAVGIAVVLSLTFAAVMTIPEVRANVFNIIIEWFDTNTSFRFSENTSREEANIVWQPSYLPDNFYEFSITNTGATTTVIYKNDDEQLIYFIYAFVHDGYSFAIDNEHSDHSEITMNGIKADLFRARTDQDSSHIIWQTGNSSLHIMSTINYEELLKMAASTSMK